MTGITQTFSGFKEQKKDKEQRKLSRKKSTKKCSNHMAVIENDGFIADFVHRTASLL
jgi:hypothetical protein